MLRAVTIAISLALCLFACEGRQRAGTVTSGGAREPREGPAVLVFDLSGGLPEQQSAGLLGLPSKTPSLDELVHEVERLAREANARGVLVRLGTSRIGLARATEVGAMLAAVGARFPVWCHADDLGNETLYLAARACRRVWLSPAGTVDAIGLAAQLVYFHRLLTDKLGLEVDFLQIGKYKGAEEPFTRDGPSPEARASLESTLGGLRQEWLQGLHDARPPVTDQVSEDGPYSAEGARERGLIDDIGYFDDARDALEKSAVAVRAEVRLGAGVRPNNGDELSELLRALAGESFGSAPVALVRATGAISMESAGGVLPESGGIVGRRLLHTLAHLEKNDDVKAVVLRIDSPGGSALASDLIWHALMQVRKRKPVVVSIGGMAASGGYYLASSGSVVFADETSIVGSIGVVGGKIAADQALQRIGVHAETIAAKTGDPTAASRAAYESVLDPWDAPTRIRLEETMTSIYQLFLARIAEGRGISIDRVAASAEGRIFSGRDAKVRGLIDEIGGLKDAIVRARAMAGLATDAAVDVAGESPGLLAAFVGDEGRTESPASRLRTMAAAVAPELLPLIESLDPVLQQGTALCALPFALTVR